MNTTTFTDAFRKSLLEYQEENIGKKILPDREGRRYTEEFPNEETYGSDLDQLILSFEF